MVCSDYFVVDYMTYIGTVNNTYHVFFCVGTATINKLNKVFKCLGDTPNQLTLDVILYFSSTSPLLNINTKTIK